MIRYERRGALGVQPAKLPALDALKEAPVEHPLLITIELGDETVDGRHRPAGIVVSDQDLRHLLEGCEELQVDLKPFIQGLDRVLHVSSALLVVLKRLIDGVLDDRMEKNILVLEVVIDQRHVPPAGGCYVPRRDGGI